ncbi:MAG: LptE family protein [Bacteroidota bacterium]|jgi:hypothetical protein
MTYFFKFISICILISLHSCKVNYSFSGASVDSNLKTISISSFQNFASLAPPTLSLSLTEALRNIISSQSSLKMVTRGGDLSLEGKIVGYTTNPLAIQASGTNGQNSAALTRLTITVQVKFTNAKDEKQNFDQNFVQFADFNSSSNLADEESRLIKIIEEKLTQDIFNRCFSNW